MNEMTRQMKANQEPHSRMATSALRPVGTYRYLPYLLYREGLETAGSAHDRTHTGDRDRVY